MSLRKYQRPRETVLKLSNMPATPTNTAASMGTTVTTGATPHAETVWTRIFTAAQITRDIHAIFLAVIDSGASATQTDCMIDLASGPDGEQSSFLTNYIAGWNANGASPGPDGDKLLIEVPRNQDIWVRARSLQTSKAVNVILCVVGYAERPADCFRGIDILGGNAAASQGTSVTPGNSGAWGNWASIGGTTAKIYHAVRPLVQGTLTNTTTSSQPYYFRIGAGDAVLANQPDWRFSATSAELVLGPFPDEWHYKRIDPGTQLQMSGKGGSTSNTFDCAIMAAYR